MLPIYVFLLLLFSLVQRGHLAGCLVPVNQICSSLNHTVLIKQITVFECQTLNKIICKDVFDVDWCLFNHDYLMSKRFEAKFSEAFSIIACRLQSDKLRKAPLILSLLPFIIRRPIDTYLQAASHVNDLTGQRRSISITFHLQILLMLEEKYLSRISFYY